MHQLKIGSVTLDNNILLAPMAGVTDLPFRLLCREQEAGLVCMEMVSAKAILYKNKNTESLLTIHPQEGPVSLQLFGSDPKILSEMARQIEERPFSILDINMGCPSRYEKDLMTRVSMRWRSRGSRSSAALRP